MKQEQKKKIAETVEQMGGEWVAPLAVAHLVKIGQQAAESITTERIVQEMKKTRAKEQEAEKQGKIYLMSAELVGEILGAVYVLANADKFTRCEIIKKYI